MKNLSVILIAAGLVFSLITAPLVTAQVPSYKGWLMNGSTLYTLNPKVGIGMLNPQYPLDIIGDIRLTGAIQGGSIPWALLINFPLACPAGLFVTAVGTSLVCGTPTGGVG